MTAPNTPLGARRYVPTLKAKGAELRALATVIPDNIVPLLELLDARGAAPSISRAWPHTGHVVWLHPFDTGDGDEPEFYDAVDELFAGIRGDVLAVPVVLVAEEAAYLGRVRTIIETDGLGVALRLDVEEVIDEAIDTASDIEFTLEALGVAPGEVDLILDGGLLQGTPVV